MNIIYWLFVVIFCSPVQQPEDTWTLRGRITDPHDNPLVGATVMIVGSSLGAMSDPNGEFLVRIIPVEYQVYQARMAGMGERTIEVDASAGDTVDVHIYLPANPHNPDDRPRITIDQQVTGTVLTDTLEIEMSNWRELEVACSQVWVAEELMPSWQKNDSTLCTALPENTSVLQLCVFPAEELSLMVPAQGNTVRITCPVDLDYQFSLSNKSQMYEHSFVDLAQWGDYRFENWRLLGAKVFYMEDDQPRILLVYHDKAVLIHGTGDPEVIDFPFPTLKFVCDPELKYVLIWDIYGQNGTSGDVALINLENGNCSVFDPTPDVDELPGHFYPVGGCGFVIQPFWGVRHHVTSDGTLIVVEEEFIRTFNRTGRMICNVSMEDIGIEHFYYTRQFLSLDQTALSAVFNDGNRNYCLSIDLEGNVLNLSPLPLLIYSMERGGACVSDPSSAVLWRSLGLNGVARIDCLSGKCSFRPGFRSAGMFYSDANHLLGIKLFSNCNPAYTVLETWDMDTGERRSSMCDSYTNPDALLPGILSMTDDGSFFGVHDSKTYMFAFMTDPDGKLFWRSPPIFRVGLRRDNLSYHRNLPASCSSLSPGGTSMVLSHGRYLIQLRFDEQEDLQ